MLMPLTGVVMTVVLVLTGTAIAVVAVVVVAFATPAEEADAGRLGRFSATICKKVEK